MVENVKQQQILVILATALINISETTVIQVKKNINNR